ncbi:MAG: hypothetical protein FWF08_02945 [Oscillospiraceae bacterium]|nr:hypothetical protein [Oscillospiraceae bacterium]
MRKLQKTAKTALALTLALMMAFPLAVPSQAAQKMSNPDRVGTGIIDGLTADEYIGRHNSYIWSTELFRQDDGDYIWAGTTRDMGGGIVTVVNNMGSSLGLDFNELIGIPPIDTANYQGRIYRQKVGETSGEWEQMYQNPLVAGWRRMIVFNGDLYVVTGTTLPYPGNYTLILRFKSDFKPGDTPEIVFWDQIPEENNSYFRAACVLNDKLYIGTFDTNIFITDGTGLTNKSQNFLVMLGVLQKIRENPDYQMTPLEIQATNPALRRVGWTACDLKEFPELGEGNNAIWDMMGFNGYLYAFLDSSTVSSSGVQGDWMNQKAGGGFTVYKLTADGPKGAVTAMRQIVGEKEGAMFPPSMGVGKPMGCSPFYAEFDGDEYIYVTTLIGGAYFLAALAVGEVDLAMDMLFFPTQIYRFDKNDNWEVVVGEKDGPRAAKYSDGTLVPHIGSQRGGFFPGEDSFENACANQYSWWMAQHNGKLYVSTWDTGVFKEAALGNIGFIITAFLSGAGKEVSAEILPSIAKAVEQLSDYIPYFSGGGELSAFKVFCKFLTSPKDIFAVVKFAFDLLISAVRHPTEINAGVKKAIASYKACNLYINDKSNPPGFDIYCTEDGINFDPVTVDGFGDKYNYGGRVLLPTEYGLFVGTANPFNGGQYWRIDELENGLLANTPNKVSFVGGGSVTFPVRAVGLDSGLPINVTVSDAGISADAVLRDGSDVVLEDYRSVVGKVRDTSVYGNFKYVEDRTRHDFDSCIFDVTLTADGPVASGNITVTVEMGGYSVSRTISIAG